MFISFNLQKRRWTIKRLSNEEREFILNHPELSSAEIAKKFGRSPSTIIGFRRCRNIKIPRTKLNVSAEEFISKYEELQSQEEMAKYYKVDHHAICNYARKIEFDDSKYKKRVVTDEERQFVLDNYLKYPVPELAKMINLNEKTVSGIAFRGGLLKGENRVYHLLNEDYFENIDSQDKAYFLGFIAADGCIYHPQDGRQDILRIEIQKRDIKVLELLAQQLATNMPIRYEKSDRYVSLAISSNKICEDIRRTGLEERKTYGNTICNISDKYMNAFFRGYFDGDGSIGSANIPSVTIAGFKKNIDKMIAFLKTLNILTMFAEDTRKYSHNDKFGYLTFPNEISKYSFLKYIYKDNNGFYLDRKYELMKKFVDRVELGLTPRDKQTVIYYKYAVQGVN